MVGRRFYIVMVSVFVLVLSITGAALADDIDETLPSIRDGRVNVHDIAAPLVVYCTFEHPDADDPDMSVMSGVEIWAFVDDEIEQVITFSSEALEKSSPGLLASGKGYALYLEADSSLTATGPLYAFNWQPGDTEGC